MLKRYLLCILLVLSLVGCSLSSGATQGTPFDPRNGTTALNPDATPSGLPSPMPTAFPSSTPTLAPTRTREPLPAPRGPEFYYKRLIVIDQDRQTMYVYQNGVMIRAIPVSTGSPAQVETQTPAWEGNVGKYVGTFFAFGTYADDAWYLFEHYGAMLIHGAPYIKQDGKKVYQELDALGVRPVSHGCIRLPPEEARWFTAWGPQGAHVIIKPLTHKF